MAHKQSVMFSRSEEKHHAGLESDDLDKRDCTDNNDSARPSHTTTTTVKTS